MVKSFISDFLWNSDIKKFARGKQVDTIIKWSNKDRSRKTKKEAETKLVSNVEKGEF